jgi:cyclase
MTRASRLAAFVAVIALIAGPSGGHAGPPEENKTLAINALSAAVSLYMLSGGGGNTLALIRDAGVVLIDTKPPGWSRAIADTLALVTEQPVTMIINTHAHIDHTGGNLDFPMVTDVIAHERARAHMQAMDRFQGANAKYLPNRIVSGKTSLFEGRDRVDLYYFGPGHTDGLSQACQSRLARKSLDLGVDS